MSKDQSRLLPAEDYLFREEPYMVKQAVAPKAVPRRKVPSVSLRPVVFRPKPVDPGVLRARAEIRTAKAQAARLLKEAKEECERLLNESVGEISGKKQEATKEGYSEGLARGSEEGYEKGQKKGGDEGFRQWAEILARWQSVLQQTVQKKTAYLADSEAIIVHLAMEIAAKVLLREIKSDPEAVLDLTRQAIHKATDRSRLIIRLNPEDVSKAQNANLASFKIAEGVKHIEFLADDKVMAGGVLIETNTGIVDARLETQLAEIARSLLEVAGNGN